MRAAASYAVSMNPIARRWLLLAALGLSLAYLFKDFGFGGDHDHRRSKPIERSTASQSESQRAPATAFAGAERAPVQGQGADSSEPHEELAQASAKAPDSAPILVDVTGVIRFQERPQNVQTKPGMVFLLPHDPLADTVESPSEDLSLRAVAHARLDDPLTYVWGPLQVRPGMYTLRCAKPWIERVVEITERGPNVFELVAPPMCQLDLQVIDAMTGDSPPIEFVAFTSGAKDAPAPSIPFVQIGNPAQLIVPSGEAWVFVHMAGDFADIRERHSLSPGSDRLVLSTTPLSLVRLVFRDAVGQPVAMEKTRLHGLTATAVGSGNPGRLVRRTVFDSMPGSQVATPPDDEASQEESPELPQRPIVNVRMTGSGQANPIVAPTASMSFASGVELAFDQPGSYLVSFSALNEALVADDAIHLEPLRVTVGGAAPEYVLTVRE